ncbi:putative late blight resistance protein homolog R1A-10, partial [Ipomoea triloba]|uniref:putative late blight resistance protein homolog R1A-10 n=1 Tax=Ipomoea triloba TaxID=35885 RepID=UPI00125D89F3
MVVGHKHSTRNLLIHILSCIVSLSNEEISKQDDEQLAQQLRKLLMGQRYFIVIDNLWSTTGWYELSTAFPDDRNGSRNNFSESSNLLSKTVTSIGKWCLPPELELIGRQIVEKCMGLPLVIVLIGVLANGLIWQQPHWLGKLQSLIKNVRQVQELGTYKWEDILLFIPSCHYPSELLHCTFELCYNYLPTHLKPCFLYFGVFPANIEIHVEKLINLWVAERFLNPEMNKDKSLEEIAKDYLFDLINRRLVQVKKRSLDRKIKSCMLHDMLRDFCFTKSIEKDINMVGRTKNKFLEGRRWLQSLQTLILSTWTKEYQLQLPCDVLDLPWLRHVRFDKGSSSYLPNLVQENLQTLSWLKVTGGDSRATNFTKVPNLKELGMYIEGEVLPNALDSLAQLHQLEKLKVKMGRAERFNLPNCFPSNLKQLTLSNTYLSWEDMNIIGQLPNLDLLKLKDFAVCGPEWTPRDGEFLQLRFFLIERSDLEHWNANANHFPALEHLILRYCWDLEKLPNDFKKVCTLRLIELGNCCSVTSAKA